MAKKNRLYTYPNGQPSDGQKLQAEFDNVYEGANNVDSTQLLDNAIISSKIANGAVIEPKIATGAVTTPKLADGAVTDVKVNASANIAQSKIAATGWMTDGIQAANTAASTAVTTANAATSIAENAENTATMANNTANAAFGIAAQAEGNSLASVAAANLALITSNALTTDYNAKLPKINAGIESIALKVDKSYVDALIADLTIGTMPDGSVDDAKLSNAPWQIKDRLAKLSLMKTAGNYSTTTFEANGSIVVRIYNSANTLLNTATTTFPANGSIITTTIWSDNYISIETTVFNVDGSITTTVTSG